MKKVFFMIDPDDKEQVALYELLELVSSRERTMIVYFYGLFGCKTLNLSEMVPIIGVSKERIRQIIQNTLAFFRQKQHKSKMSKIKHKRLIDDIYGKCDCGCLYRPDIKVWLIGNMVICDTCESKKVAA